MYRLTIQDSNYDRLISCMRDYSLTMSPGAFLNAFVLPSFFRLKEFRCPKCLRPFALERSLLGRPQYCPYCGSKLGQGLS